MNRRGNEKAGLPSDEDSLGMGNGFQEAGWEQGSSKWGRWIGRRENEGDKSTFLQEMGVQFLSIQFLSSL